MISFKEFIIEIFDQSPYNFNKEETNYFRTHKYNFSSPHDNYTVFFNHYKKHAETHFRSHEGGTKRSNAEGKNASKVFSTVHHIIKHHLNNNPHIQTLGFAANRYRGEKNSNRINLYRHMIKKLTNSSGNETNTGNGLGWQVNRKDIKGLEK